MGEEEKELLKEINNLGYKICMGKAGTMESSEITVVIETASKIKEIFMQVVTEKNMLYII